MTSRTKIKAGILKKNGSGNADNQAVTRKGSRIVRAPLADTFTALAFTASTPLS